MDPRPLHAAVSRPARTDLDLAGSLLPDRGSQADLVTARDEASRERYPAPERVRYGGKRIVTSNGELDTLCLPGNHLGPCGRALENDALSKRPSGCMFLLGTG